jgi:hypothetical protein
MTRAAAPTGSDGRHVRTVLTATLSSGGGDVMVSASVSSPRTVRSVGTATSLWCSWSWTRRLRRFPRDFSRFLNCRTALFLAAALSTN